LAHLLWAVLHPFTSVNFNFPGSNINTITTALKTVTPTDEPAPKVLDFSQWEAEAPVRETYRDLGFDGEGIGALLAQSYGLSETLKANFPFLTNKNGTLKALLKASYSFEHLGRDVTYEQLGAVLNCNCNSAYQQGLKLREAYQEAFGLQLTSTKEGIHLATVNEAQVINDRLIANFEKHILPALTKFGGQLRSLQQTNQQYALSARTQALLQAALTEDEG
jgi:hypothetical protein